MSANYDRAKKAAEAVSLAKRYRADNPKVVSVKAEIEADFTQDKLKTLIANGGKAQ